MARSATSQVADWLVRRPEWLERDGERDVLVQGYSPLDNVIFGLLAALMILTPIILLLVALP